MHVQAAIVVDAAQPSELIQKETHSGPRRTDHVGEHFINGRILLAKGSYGRQSPEAEDAGLRPRALVEPGHEPLRIDQMLARQQVLLGHGLLDGSRAPRFRTAAVVVCTCVRRCGAASSHLSLIWTM